MFDFKKESISIDTDIRGTDDLCLMCGKCCKAITTKYSHEELIEMAKSKQKESQVFVDFFKKYDSIEDARRAVPDQVEQVLDLKRQSGCSNVEDTSFYYCAYIDENNMCTVHKDRPLCCRTAPANGWSLMPPGCGYIGWQFEEREKIKATIRILKETLYEVETIQEPDSKIEEMNNISVSEFKEMINSKVKFFKIYGAEKW